MTWKASSEMECHIWRHVGCVKLAGLGMEGVSDTWLHLNREFSKPMPTHHLSSQKWKEFAPII